MNDHADDECRDNVDAHGAAAHADGRAHAAPCHPSCPCLRAGDGRRGCARACGIAAPVRDCARAFPSNAARCLRPSALRLA